MAGDPEQKLSAGDRVEILVGDHAGEQGEVTALDILSIGGLGRRCFVQLATGKDAGKTVAVFSKQLRKLPG